MVFHRSTNVRGGYNTRSSRTITSMTRPPFAEFSSLAIRELNAWLGRQDKQAGTGRAYQNRLVARGTAW